MPRPVSNRKRSAPHEDVSSSAATSSKSNKRPKNRHNESKAAEPERDLTEEDRDALLSSLSRLPIKDREERYSHSLKAQYAIQIDPTKKKLGASQKFPYVFQERLLNSTRKKSGAPKLDLELNKRLQRSLSVHFTGIQNDLSHEAHAYFLEHNTFLIRQVDQVPPLVQLLHRLQEVGHPVSIGHLRVRMPKRVAEWDGDYDSDGRVGASTDGGDFGDHNSSGPADFRLLQQLLRLPIAPQNLTIVANIVNGYPTVGHRHFNSGLEYVAAAIARLKERVLKGHNNARFAIFAPNIKGQKKDYTYLWNDLTEDQKTRYKQFLADRQALEELDNRMFSYEERQARRYSGFRPDASHPSAGLAGEVDRLKARIKPALTDEKLMEHCRVYELAKEPQWEARADSEASSSWFDSKDTSQEEKDADNFIGEISFQWFKEARGL